MTTDELNQKYKSIIRDYEAKIDDQEMRFQKTIIEIGEEFGTGRGRSGGAMGDGGRQGPLVRLSPVPGREPSLKNE